MKADRSQSMKGNVKLQEALGGFVGLTIFSDCACASSKTVARSSWSARTRRVLPLLLLLWLSPAVQAQFLYTIIENGTITNGTITITGYYGPGGAVTIPSKINVGGVNLPVTVIHSQAFYLNNNVTSVDIPDSITNIEAWAFQLCGVLTNVTMGKGVISLGDEAFAQCQSLTTITVDPANPAYCSVNDVLFNKTKTILIQFPVGNGATTYNIPDGVTSIADDAFSAWRGLTNITMPNSVTSIGFASFNLGSLTSIKLSTNLTSIGQSSFSGTPRLTSITIPNSVTSIGDSAFAYSGLTSITIGPCVTNMGYAVFYSCSRLTNVTIGSGVISIGSKAFASCPNLTSVYLTGNTPILGSEVFGNDTNVTIYYLPGTTGWDQWVGPPPAVLWRPQIQPNDGSFGVQSNQFGFNVAWASGMVVVVEACTNLAGRTWLPLQTNTLSAASLYFSDPDWTNYPARLYRIRGVTNAPPPPPGAPTILIVLTNYGQVILSWSTPSGATSYNVKRSPNSGGAYTVLGNTSSTHYTDTTVLNGSTYYYVVSAIGVGGEGRDSPQVSATPPQQPVPDPQIGYVDFPSTAYPPYTSVFHPVMSFVTNNYVPIVIVGRLGSQTFYTYGATGSNIPDPTSSSASTPSGYQDGLLPEQVAMYTVATVMPDLTIKAIGMKADGSPNSAVVQARFQFVGGQFSVTNITLGAPMPYAADGSTSTNAAPSVGGHP
jgi:hypothetical protein